MKTSELESCSPLILVMNPRLKIRADNDGTGLKLKIKNRGHSNRFGKVIMEGYRSFHVLKVG